MGAACGKKAPVKTRSRQEAIEVLQPSTIPSHTQPHQDGEPTSAAPPCNVPPSPPVAAPSVAQSTIAVSQTVKEFVTGEGDGVYLILTVEGGGSLVQQYLHNRPQVADGDYLLMQIKPPLYVEIKETRFTLQNGKRTLRQGLSLMKTNKDMKKRMCEAVQEFLRLFWVYSGYFHTYEDIDKAPFTVLMVVEEKHPIKSIQEGPGGRKFVATAATDYSQESGGARDDVVTPSPHKEEVAADPPPEKTKDGASEDGEGAEKEAAEGKQTIKMAVGRKLCQSREKVNGDGKSDKIMTIFEDVKPDINVPLEEDTTARRLSVVQILRHLMKGRSPNSSCVRQVIVVPQPEAEAGETLKDGLVVEEADVAALQKEVEACGGVMLVAPAASSS